MTGIEALRAATVLAVAGLIGALAYLLEWTDGGAASDLAGPFTGQVALGFGLFVAAVAVGELVPLPQPGRGIVPLSVAVIATYALLVRHPLDTAVLAAAGSGSAWLIAAVHGDERPRGRDVVAATFGGWMTAGAAAAGTAFHAGLPASLQIDVSGVSVPAMVAVALTVLLGTEVWSTFSDPANRGSSTGYLLRLRGGWLAGAALASAALLGALVYEPLELAALPLVLLPLLAARAGLRRHATVRVTHDQTVRAFSRLPEELGTVPPGHGVRVADTVVQAARELGIPADLLPSVERAAHLHELGRIRGEPGELLEPATVALAGASILREGGLGDVADIVGRHRETHLPADDPVATAARLIRIACDVDRAIEEHGESGLHAASLAVTEPEDLRVLSAVTAVMAPQPVG
jgi:hypothetical protein